MQRLELYSRDAADGCTEVFCRDHNGQEHVLTRWQRSKEGSQLLAQPEVWIGAAPEPVQMAEAQNPKAWELSELLDNASQEMTEATGIPAEQLPPAEPEPATIDVSAAPLPEQREVVIDDTPRRRQAKASIRTAVAALSRNTYDLQMRYELALQAKNKNTRALEMFDNEAKAAGVTVAELINRVVADRHAREELMMRVYAAQAQALANLDKATGPEIAVLEAAALSYINDAV